MNVHLLTIGGAQRARRAHVERGGDDFSRIICQQAVSGDEESLTTGSLAGWQ
jgi:hypothetical protein